MSKSKSRSLRPTSAQEKQINIGLERIGLTSEANRQSALATFRHLRSTGTPAILATSRAVMEEASLSGISGCRRAGLR